MAKPILQELEIIIEAEARRLEARGITLPPALHERELRRRKTRKRESDPTDAMGFLLILAGAAALIACTVGVLVIENVISVPMAVLLGVISWVLVQFLALGFALLRKDRPQELRSTAGAGPGSL